jgi:CheY-like chemotaxis protein
MKKILIVEDTEMNLELLIQLLEDEFELFSATDGESGIVMAAKTNPDLIIMDMSLPVKDGWTAMGEIKANPSLDSIPIIALSAHAMQADQRKALENGCNAYLTKPIDETVLMVTIRSLIGWVRLTYGKRFHTCE